MPTKSVFMTLLNQIMLFSQKKLFYKSHRNEKQEVAVSVDKHRSEIYQPFYLLQIFFNQLVGCKLTVDNRLYIFEEIHVLVIIEF